MEWPMIYTVQARFGIYDNEVDSSVVYCGESKEKAFNFTFEQADKEYDINSNDASEACNALCIQVWQDEKLIEVYIKKSSYKYEPWVKVDLEKYCGFDSC